MRNIISERVWATLTMRLSRDDKFRLLEIIAKKHLLELFTGIEALSIV